MPIYIYVLICSIVNYSAMAYSNSIVQIRRTEMKEVPSHMWVVCMVELPKK
jgi:hypothetical protein